MDERPADAEAASAAFGACIERFCECAHCVDAFGPHVERWRAQHAPALAPTRQAPSAGSDADAAEPMEEG